MAKKLKAHSHEEEHIDETWLIPYADLLTLLLALFIVLFASSNIDVKKYDQIMTSFNEILSGGTGILDQSTPYGVPEIQSDKKTPNDQEMSAEELRKEQQLKEQETIDLENLKKQLDLYIDENQLTTELETTLNTMMLTITIRDNALFASGSANVKEEASNLAVAISNMLQDYPQYEIIVSGHTDNRPINTVEFNSNWDLSSKRAINFMKILLENKRIVPERFSAVGYGEYRPLATNDTIEGRAINRRVEVSIIRNFQSVSPTVVSAE